ncbi:phosphoribosyltransferase family protein [Demequina capsici]|uniref:Phosphoribosyltransferase family protein n=1 Tax=Demequina capsici TaxID=3075620 RepID=A0AA96JAJ1_9MICO|nr:phosphoribosyltransferase family protein [Demequina sp. PMTSA13]WNM27043.1 phosphoribosyltransferase family protein [Demequina sp. PMTSA13]
MNRLRDRVEAGAAVARLLEPLLEGDDALVLGLPRGGVIVARAVADTLHLDLDVLVVRKLGVPGHEEFGFGALGEDDVQVTDLATLAMAGLSDAAVDVVVSRERAELDRRVVLYRGDMPPARVAGRTVVIVDDGIATGGTVRAAIAVCRARGAGRIIVAVGVAPGDVIDSLSHEADAAIAVLIPQPMDAVGQWYEDFRQSTDDEVVAALAGAG